MNAMPALKLNVENLPLPGAQIRKAKNGGAKVINLKGREAKPRALSQRRREDIVLESRPKARKLARSILRKWHARLDLEEVDSIVDLSLCEAVQRFNPAKGASFMTFFFYHLRGNLIRAVTTAANLNSVPLPEGDLMDRAQGQDGACRGGSAIEVAEALCGFEAPMPDDLLHRKQVALLSTRACDKLDSLEREVINRVYLEEQQLMDIAHTLGYSRCHISRVKRKALETLYQELRATAQFEDLGAGPMTEEEDGEELRRPSARRSIQRRRPRSTKQCSMSAERLAILEASAPR